MTPRKKRRLHVLVLCLAGLGTATGLTLTAMQDNLQFFHSPSDLRERSVGDRPFRLGGLVEEGTVRRSPDGHTVEFRVTDLANTVPVVYAGVLPNLFREGQGVVAEGRLRPDGVFEAREILAKHDETYTPPEVKDALARAGHPSGQGRAAAGMERQRP
ncbi:MAG TPA: cytochrome c maturation protein CcmE [Azospirillaceae bacterium]|nr:cytochrome c maturation protein CcmE [Azospirillaceae bacterium]